MSDVDDLVAEARKWHGEERLYCPWCEGEPNNDEPCEVISLADALEAQVARAEQAEANNAALLMALCMLGDDCDCYRREFVDDDET